MTEHMHEWRFGYRSDGNYNLPGASTPGFYCVHKECGYASGTWLSLVEAEARLNALEKSGALKEALIIALHLLAHADFKNGNTGPNGIIDEGEVYAGRLIDKIIKMLIPQLYADILEGK